MNLKKVPGHSQGKFPKLLKDKEYKQTLEALFVDGMKMAGADALAIAEVLKKNGCDSVFIGGIVVGCHTGRPRATRDVDVIVGKELNKKTIDEIGKVVGAKRCEQHSSFTSFIAKSIVGDIEILDIITSKAGSYGHALENTIDLTINGQKVKIPTAEMMIVLKYTAAMNPIRPKAKQLQDWADIYAILDANKKISTYTIEYLANEIVPGWGEDIRNKIIEHFR